MQVYKINSIYQNVKSNLDIAIGYFDGCHLGHQQLLGCLKNSPTVVTFDSHLFKDSIFTLEQRLSQLKYYGIENVYVLDMNVFVNIKAAQFITFLTKFTPNKIVIGMDFKFGHKAKGNYNDLSNYFDVVAIPEYLHESKKVSSSVLKEYFKVGNIKMINKLLDRNYSVFEKVIVDQKLGATIGFATANVICTNEFIKYGVYMTNTKINGIIYKSITNVGIRPTVKDNSLRIETHILNFDQNIYGQMIEVIFIDFIRSEMKFTSLDELKLQIKKDIKIVKDGYGN